MAKKKQRAHQVSKGERKSQNLRWTKEARREWVGSTAQANAKIEAFRKGKNVVLTIANPNKAETNKPFIKVNAKEIYR
jgi:hypothetical protein